MNNNFDKVIKELNDYTDKITFNFHYFYEVRSKIPSNFWICSTTIEEDKPFYYIHFFRWKNGKEYNIDDALTFPLHITYKRNY